MKILNLYAGIGGNRKLWGTGHDITAVEINPDIAKIYQDFFPDDTMIVGDAHQYLLKHFDDFDFIWTSPPCPSHSNFSKLRALSDDVKTGNHLYEAKYIEMSLYQEIILLQHYFKGKWIIENVIPYYDLLIPAQKIQRHLFWSNYFIRDIKVIGDNIKHGTVEKWQEDLDVDLSPYKIDKRKALRNCVDPELGLHILKCSQDKELELFN